MNQQCPMTIIFCQFGSSLELVVSAFKKKLKIKQALYYWHFCCVLTGIVAEHPVHQILIAISSEVRRQIPLFVAVNHHCYSAAFYC